MADDELKAYYIDTDDRLADIFTKALDKIKLEKFYALIGVRPALVRPLASL